jgi:acetylglutamate kinase
MVDAVKTILLKYGGNAMGASLAEDPVLAECARLTASGMRILLVHGGGPQIDAALRARGIEERRVAGLRVTDAESMDVVEAVLAATVNKALVRALIAHGLPAIGISGVDGAFVQAVKAPPIDGVDLGFVGVVEKVDPRAVMALLEAGFAPVIAPIGLDMLANSSLNVNADAAAGAIAGALAVDAYVVLTNVAGVRRDINDPDSVIATLTIAEAEAFIADGTFSGGMIPKMLSAIDALRTGAQRVVIGGAQPGAIADALAGRGTELIA